jgi:hypothetical protein
LACSEQRQPLEPEPQPQPAVSSVRFANYQSHVQIGNAQQLQVQVEGIDNKAVYWGYLADETNGDPRFEAYHDIPFSRFDSLRADSFNEIATEAAVPDTKQFAACASRTDSVPRISADRTLAMDTLHIIGTPTVIVNAMMYAFAPPLGELRRMVKDARSHASAR